MLNKLYLTGNLGSAPKIFKTQDGKEIAILSLATNTSWKNDQGEWQSQTDWHRITVFRDTVVSWAKENLRKGDSLLIEGRLSYGEVGSGSQTRKIACVVVSGREGNVHLLRSGRQKDKDISDPTNETKISSSSQQPTSTGDSSYEE